MPIEVISQETRHRERLIQSYSTTIPQYSLHSKQVRKSPVVNSGPIDKTAKKMISFQAVLRLMLAVGLFSAVASAGEEAEETPRKLAKSSKSRGYYAYSMNYHPRYYYPGKGYYDGSSSSSSSSYREPVYPRGKGKGNVFFNPYVPHMKIRKMGKGGYVNFYPRIPGPGPEPKIPFGIWPRVPFVPDTGPTASPSASPTAPTAAPTSAPTANPTSSPTDSPTTAPIIGTAAPTVVCVNKTSIFVLYRFCYSMVLYRHQLCH